MIHQASSKKAEYASNNPSNKQQDKDLHWNETQCESEEEDDLVNPSFHQIWNENSSMMLKKKVLVINTY